MKDIQTSKPKAGRRRALKEMSPGQVGFHPTNNRYYDSARKHVRLW